MPKAKSLLRSLYLAATSVLLLLFVFTQTGFANVGYTGDYSDIPYYNTTNLLIEDAQELNYSYDINEVATFRSIQLDSSGKTVEMRLEARSLLDNHSLSLDEGWAAQFYVYRANSRTRLQSLVDEGSYNMEFNGTSWYGDFNLEENGTYQLQFLIYCAPDQAACRDSVSDRQALRTIKYPFNVSNNGIKFHDQVISDATTNNNTTPTTVYKPDFELNNIYLDGNSLAIQTINRGATYNNKDGHTYIWIDGELEWTYSWSTLADTNFLQDARQSVISPQTLYGTHTVKACVDANNVVNESNETNNCKTVVLNGRQAPSTPSTPEFIYPVITINSNKTPSSNGKVKLTKGQNVTFKATYTQNNISSGGSTWLYDRGLLDCDSGRMDELRCEAIRVGSTNVQFKFTANIGDRRTIKSNTINVIIKGPTTPSKYGSGSVTLYSSVPNGKGGTINLTPGQKVDFTRQISSNVDGGWAWNWDKNVLDCSPIPDFDSGTFRCSAVNSGTTDVSYSFFPIINGNSRTKDKITSNEFTVVVNGACEAPFVKYKGACTDPIPACKNWPKNAATCIDKIENGKYIERYSVQCRNGFDKIGKECVKNGATTTSTNTTRPDAGFENDVLVNEVDSFNPFSDVNKTTLEGKAAVALYKLGIIGGFPDGTFRGKRPVNRAEAAKFLLLSKYEAISDVPNDGFFRDVMDDQWYTKYVMTAAGLGIINGYSDKTFKPAQTVNTAEFLKMLSKTFDLNENLPYSYRDVKSSDWFAKYAGVATEYNLFPTRNGSFLKPATLLTRNEVAVAIYRYLLNR